MRMKLVAGASLLAITLVPAAALAAPVVQSWTLGATYGQSQISGEHLNNWGAAGQGVLPIGAGNWAVQGDLTYNEQSISGTDIHTTNGVISGFYQDPMGMGRIGASVGYGTLDLAGETVNNTSYGLFGDWYVSSAVTVSGRFGGLSFSGGGISTASSYAGAQLVGYATPDVAISGTVDYFKLGPINDTTESIKAEWLISQTAPISVFASYGNTQLKEFGTTDNINTYTVGVKVYFGGNASLKERQRDGAESWGSTPVIEDLF